VVKRLLCALIILRARSRVPEEYGSIEYYKEAPIRDPALDREQTSKNVSPTTKTYKRERKVVNDQEGRASGKERGLRATTAGSVERAACSICDRVKISRSDGCRPLKLSSGCDCIVEEDGESSRHDHSRE
jgi:hypothetical protein